MRRLVDVGKTPSNPIPEVDFRNSRLTRRLILSEEQMAVEEIDTRLSTDKTQLNASKIAFRVTNIVGGELQRRGSGSSDVWEEITSSVSGGVQFRKFSLSDLRGGLVSFLADAGVLELMFDIQAADAGMPNDPSSSPHLSDSDFSKVGEQPAGVSIPVVVLKEIAAGKEMRVNDDDALTPNVRTLDVWVLAATAAGDSLSVLVALEGGREMHSF